MRFLPIILAVFLLVSCKNNLEVNKLLSERIEVLDKDYKLYLSKIEMKYAQNYVKTKPYFDRTKYIQKVFDTLIKEIDNSSSLKKDIYIQLNQSFDTILSYYNSNDKGDYLSMYEKILVFNNNFKSGEKYKAKLFLHYDLRLIRNEITRYLYAQVDRFDYKFNLIEPVVLENKNVLKVGEIYSAKIILSAYDTTTMPQFLVDGELLDHLNGAGRYNVKANRRGRFEWNGIMRYFNTATQEFEELPFASSYVVK